MEFKEKVLKQIEEELNSSLKQTQEQVKTINEKAKLEASLKEKEILKEYENEASTIENLIQEKRIELKNDLELNENEVVSKELQKFYETLETLRKDKEFQKNFKKIVEKTVKEAGKEFELTTGTIEATYLKGKTDKNLKGAIVHNEDKTIVFDLSLDAIFEKIKPFLYNKAYNEFDFEKVN